jgi:hypothetical protein
MNTCVVDTNVLLVANGSHDDVSPECVIACVTRLKELMESGILVVDDGYRILSEYQNKSNSRNARGVGDVFVRWVLRHIGQENRVQQVSLTESEKHRYAEFPDAELEPLFDAPDRMFAAVSNTHADRPPIWQATDCKWLNWWEAMHACGIDVEFLCKDDVCRFYAKKFPNKEIPEFS